ncbi:C40 family peptidase [Cytobacillus massiliigabonensis]|uniref:C40 family peptidase n=1 Tax=Cytobacillus massiliigabonensis TaxID=1871011 RepID=UPI000C81B159|nr:C40 family peptidase [Cytobacillus massiliigabonensis]
MRKALTALFVFFLCLVTTSTFASAASEGNYDRLMAQAKKYIGLPYKYGGTTASGFDCSGYTQYVMKALGLNLPRTTSGQYGAGESISKDNLRIGDLVFFVTYKKGPSHVGIYIGDNQFIHSSTSKGIITTDLDDPHYFGPRYIGARRVLTYDLPVGKFHDVPKDFWAFDSIKDVSEDHLFLGYENSYFKPDEEMTRALVASVMAQTLDLNMSDRNEVFSDVKKEFWASGAIHAVNKKDLFKVKGKEFQPNNTITRGEVAVVLYEAFNLKAGGKETAFTDVDKGNPAYAAIQALAANDIAAGFEDGTFRPDEKVNRAQFVVMLDRAKDSK